MLSIIFNAANFIMILGAVAAALKSTEEKKAVFRYFTVLSNLFCAAASFAVAFCRIAGGGLSFASDAWTVSGGIPLWLSLVKYVSTCAVTVTLMTVVLFLAPRMGGFGELLKGFNFFLHLLCPMIAIVSYLLWDQVPSGFPTVLLGILPVLFYGTYYMYRVLKAPEGRRWDDFYTFNREGKWKLSFAAMTLGALVISIVLWVA